MRRPFALMIVACAALAAASTSRHARSQPSSEPRTAVELQPSAADFRPPNVADRWLAVVPSAPVQLKSWNDALDYLRTRSTDLKLALLDAVRADAQIRVALAGALPTITGTANVTRNVLRGEQTTTDISPLFQTPPGAPVFGTVSVPVATTVGGNVTLAQPLVALRAWYAIGTAELAAQAARMSVEDKKRTIALITANSVMTVVTAERVAEINRIGLRAALERLELTKKRASLGASSALDVLRAEQDCAQARTSIVAGDETLLKAREALGLALGVGHPIGVSRDASLPDLEASARKTCTPGDMLEARADIVAARKHLVLGERSVRDVWLQFAPTVNLMSKTDFYSEMLPNNRNVAWSIAGVLTIPLWDGGARYGLLRDARAQREQAQTRLDATRRAALIEVEQARRAVLVSQQGLEVASQARDLAKEQDRLTRISFEIGKATSFELVDAGRQLRSAEVNLAVKELDVVQARTAAYLALAACSW